MTCVILVAYLVRIAYFTMTKELLKALHVCFLRRIKRFLWFSICTMRRAETRIVHDIWFMAIHKSNQP